MPIEHPTSHDPDPLIDRVKAMCACDPSLQGAEPVGLIRHVPGKRAILSGRFDGKPAVFRLNLDPEDPMPAREWAELTRIWPQMCDGRYRVVEPLHFSEAHRLNVIATVPGTPLLQYLYKSDPIDRAVVLRPAAEWLRHYTKSTERFAPEKHDAWLRRAEEASGRQPFTKLRRKEARILVELKRLSSRLVGQTWRYAICHGDYHPNNLILNGDRLTGIDTGGSARLPVYKDIARFLMHMGRRGMLPSGSSRYGVDAQGLEAFADAFEMNEVERDLSLPFMLGCEALLRVENKDMKRSRIRRADAMYDRLLADLTRL